VADDAQRGVTFTLKANVDPSAKQIMDGWFNGINSSIENLGNATSAAAASTTQSVASATSAAQQSVAGSTATQASQIQQFFDQTNQAAQAYLDSQAQRAAQQAQREQQLRDVSQMSLQELLDEQNANTVNAFEREKQIMNDALQAEEAAMRKYFEAIDALRQKALQDSDSITDQEIADVQLLEREAVDAAQRRSSAESRFTNAQEAERRREVQEGIRGIRETEAENKRAVAAAERRNQQLSSSAGRIVSAFSEGSEALMRFVNGIQHLGLVGEKDLQKVQDAILRIQGTTQIFTGLIRMFRQASEGMDAYRRMVELTSQAHAVSAAAATADTAATELNTAAVVQNGAARSVANGGMMARAATGAANVGTSLINAGTVVGLEAGASALGVFLAAVGAVAGALFAAVSVIQVFKESLTFGFGGGAGKGSYTETIGTSSYNPFQRIYAQGQMFETETPVLRELAKLIPSMQGIRTGVGMAMDFTGLLGINKQTSLEKEQADAAKMEKARQDFREHNLKLQVEAEKEIKQITSERQSIVVKQHAAEQDAHRARMQSMKQEDQRAALIKEIAAIEHNQTLEAEDRARKVIALQRERLAVEKEINREQSQGAKEQLRNLEEASKIAERDYEQALKESMSAAERFGLLKTDEQQELVDIQRRFRAGAGSVDVEELKKIKGFSAALDRQIFEEAKRRASASGFGAFQREDLAEIQQLDKERQQLQIKVKAQADVVAKLEIDIDATAREINKQISAQFKIVLEEMAKQIADLQGKQTTIENRMINRFGGRVQQ